MLYLMQAKIPNVRAARLLILTAVVSNRLRKMSWKRLKDPFSPKPKIVC